MFFSFQICIGQENEFPTKCSCNKGITIHDLTDSLGIRIENLDNVHDVYFKGKRYSGLIRICENNQLYKLTEYKNGVLDGTSYSAHNGIVSSKTIFKNGIIQENYSYFPNGQIKFKGGYLQGERNGQWIRFFEDGTIYQIESYIKDVIQSRFVYFENGFLQEVNFYENNLPSGSWLFFHENGSLIELQQWLAGKKEGTWVNYYENGKIAVEENYKNDKKDGLFISYYENGQVKEQGLNFNGLLEGQMFEYFQDGTIKLEAVFEKGVMISCKGQCDELN